VTDAVNPPFLDRSCRTGLRLTLGVALVSVFAPGCKRDDQLIRRVEDAIAVTSGDFDDVVEPLNRMVVARTEYEGLISVATWDDTYNADNVALKVETLLGNRQEMLSFGSIWVASGTRGLGRQQYNGVEPDNTFLTDADVPGNVQDFVSLGGTLLVTDWAYDLVELAFPEYIEFLGDDAEPDAAQSGELGTYSANVLEAELVDAIDSDTLGARFDFSNWAVIESVSEDVTVWAEADVKYRLQNGEGTQDLAGVPLLVSFQPYGPTSGKVVYSSFHVDAQNDAVIDALLRTLVGPFEEHADDPVAPIQ